MRRRALGRDHLDQGGLNAISFQAQRQTRSRLRTWGGAVLEPSPLSPPKKQSALKKTKPRNAAVTKPKTKNISGVKECPSGRHCGFVEPQREEEKGRKNGGARIRSGH